MLLKKIEPPYVPHVESMSDKESNFVKEKNASAEKVNKEDDPFLDWWYETWIYILNNFFINSYIRFLFIFINVN